MMTMITGEWGEAGGLTRGRRTVAVTTMSMSLVFRVWDRGPRAPEVGGLLALEYSQVPKREYRSETQFRYSGTAIQKKAHSEPFLQVVVESL